MRRIRRLIGEGAGKSRSGGLEGLEREGKEPRNPEKEGDTERTGPKSGWEVEDDWEKGDEAPPSSKSDGKWRARARRSGAANRSQKLPGGVEHRPVKDTLALLGAPGGSSDSHIVHSGAAAVAHSRGLPHVVGTGI